MNKKFLLYLFCILILPIISLLLCIFGLKITKRILTVLIIPRKNKKPSNQIIEKERALFIANVVEWAGLTCFKRDTNCLSKALLILALMNHDGLEGTIYLGIQKSITGYYNFHAWIDFKGLPLENPYSINQFPKVFKPLQRQWSNIE